jgi:FixJ family two-component response regulator
MYNAFQCTPARAARPLIHVVDDDPSVRRALCHLLRAADYDVCECESAEAFLQMANLAGPGCAILDLSMPDVGGLALQQAMIAHGIEIPVVFLSGLADVPACAQAMRCGASDFLTKPVDDELLLAAIERALERDAQRRVVSAQRESVETRMSRLTPREREVLEHVVTGQMNKQIAADLGTAEKTVKVHRARVMEKMEAGSVADLVRMVERTLSPRTASQLR